MMKYENYTDVELVDLFKSGDSDAFSRIYRKYWAPLVLHVNNFLKDEDQSKDIVQEVFTWLLNRSNDLEIKTSLENYLISSVRHKVLDVIRHGKVKGNYLDSLVNYSPSSISVDSEYYLKELSSLIDTEIQNMPIRMREIFNLSRKHHLSHKEIAKLLDISENTVNAQIQRAIKQLRSNEEINNYGAAVIACVIFQLQSR